MEYKPTPGRILVRPDADYCESGGIRLAAFNDLHKYRSFIGTVVAVNPILPYYGPEIREIDAKKGGDGRQAKGERLHAATMNQKVPMELIPGDKVLFRYLYGLEKEGDIAMRYDDLYLRIRGEEVYPLNGYVIVELDEPDSFLFDPNEDRNMTSGKVLLEGCLVEDYMGGGKDFPMDIMGKTVWFEKFHAIRIENDATRTFGGERSWYKVHRKDIVCHV